MEINVATNVTSLTQIMNAFGKDQLPFAMAQSMNQTAFEMRTQTIERTWPGDVTQRNKRFMRSAMMTTTKRSGNYATKKNLNVTVGNYPKGHKMNRDFMERLAVGGVKKPRGTSLAIPGRDASLPRTAGGAIRKANRPRQLLNRKNVFRITSKGGADLIVRRATKKRYPLQVLYLMDSDGNVKKQFDFYEDAGKQGKISMARNFKKNFKKAQASAKPKRR